MLNATHHRQFTRLSSASIAMVLISLTPVPALATLIFYYDPDTGNVSFDTADTRTGVTYLYALEIYEGATPIRFLPENHIRLTDSTISIVDSVRVQETTLVNPLRGLFTIGEVLPAGISEDTWSNLFKYDAIGKSNFSERPSSLGQHGYQDAIGQGFGPPAEFVYGPPAGEYDNRWHLIDPDTLSWAQSAKLIYRERSGEVLIDTTGVNSGFISSYLMGSNNAFLIENYTPILETPLADAEPDNIGLLANAIEPGRYSLGNILQAGMTPQEFEATFTHARFLAQAGFSGIDFDYESDGISLQFVYQAVPEPATAITLLMGLAALLTRQQKIVSKIN